MSPNEDACPYEETSRAARCKGCIASNGVPPCVAAYLAGAAAKGSDTVVPLFRVQPLKRAA